MTERERLIEIIRKAEADCANMKQCEACEHCGKGDQCQEELIADYLLANGAFCPPCKVGSKVYKITRNKVKECEVVYVGISADEKCSHFNFVENYEDGKFYKAYSMVFEVIGKTVFLTREEAEKALAERSKA